MSARRTPINLLPKSEFELSYWGRFLKWALSTGRYIIILTEIVVIAAFLSRFKFDQELADLTDAVNNKLEILKHTASSEARFRQVQSRMEAAAVFLTEQSMPAKILDDMAAAMPAGIRITSTTITADEVSAVAEAANESEVGRFLNQLEKKWSSVTLKEISTSENEGVKFSFSARY